MDKFTKNYLYGLHSTNLKCLAVKFSKIEKPKTAEDSKENLEKLHEIIEIHQKLKWYGVGIAKPVTVNRLFVAYFLEYAIVRTSSVRPSVCLSVDASTLHRVDRLGRFMARSIAYGPRTLTKEGFFLRQSWTGWEGSEVQFPLYFI